MPIHHLADLNPHKYAWINNYFIREADLKTVKLSCTMSFAEHNQVWVKEGLLLE